MPVPNDYPQKKQKKGKPTKKGKLSSTEETKPQVVEATTPLVTSNVQRMDTEAAAIYLGGESSPISPDTLADWRYRRKPGGPRWHKVGRLVRYTKEDLDAYLATRHMGEE